MYKIRLAENSNEILKAKELVRKFFTRNYKTYPVEIPDFFLVAENIDTREIVATISLDCKLPGQEKILEVERYFEFSFDSLVPDIKEKGAGEIGRWVSTDSHVTIYILLGSFLLGRNLNVGYITSFQKAKVARLATKRYKLPLEWFQYDVKEYMRTGAYKEYFGPNDLVIFVQNTDVLIKSIEEHFGYPDDIIFDIPTDINEILNHKVINYGPEILSE